MSVAKNGVAYLELSSTNVGSMIEMRHDSGHVSVEVGENVLVGTWKTHGL